MNLIYITKESNLYSGCGMVISELIKGFSGEHNITLICPTGTLQAWANKFGKTIKHVRSDLNLFDLFRVRRGIPLKSTIHIHGISSLIFGIFCGLGRTRNLFYTEHLWTNDLKLPSFISGFFQKLALLFLSPMVKKIVCVSKSVKKFFEAHGVSSNKLVVIYNSVPTPQEVVTHSPKEELIISTVGNFSFSKGYNNLAEVIDLIPASIPIKVCIAGSGSELNNFKNLIKDLGIETRFELMGQVPSVTNLLLNSDVYIQTSISESFGLGIAQALSVGLPVVAYKVGGIPEVVQDNKNGYLTRLNDTIDFAHKLKTLLTDNELRTEFGKHGIMSMKKFSSDKFLRKHNAVYGLL
ncbi:glycosyltransferase family 4 protein [Candidatus Dojkabacteria bacterium]|nr:glycosyltransferase family 4 protein [Candidatus Dojkabacteria bacterium]